ncbi:MAG: ABC-type cobalamin uptake system permease component BtuC [Oceanicaulis sp. HLUCCA04]|nr:MAG: ABC-type cobalamin uptake system permease component BtuC [Oceanicaulis sp. HLUCCA04]
MMAIRINLALGLLASAAVLLALSVNGGGADLIALLSADAGNDLARILVLEIRLPRILSAFGVGAALGLAGAALQGLLRNPLADPGVLGVSGASALGAVIAVYFNLAALSVWALPGLAIVMALGVTALLYTLGARSVSTTRLILVGVGLSSLAGSVMALLMNLAPNPFSLSDLVNWLLGSVANRSWADIGFAAPFWAAGVTLVLMAAPGLRALTLGEEGASGLGANVSRIRLLVITGTALLTGASVAVAGIIGFVGIVAPHVMRPFVHHDPGDLLVPSALFAGTVLVLADTAVRVLPFAMEMKLGVAAALIGAPAFIWIAARARGIGQ